MDAIPTVYVVDDNLDHRDILNQHLSNAGYQVRSFSSGTEFLGLQAWDPVGCILLDNQMPVMSGLDVHDRLRSLECDLPVIFISGGSGIAEAVTAVKNGAVGFLEKPIPVGELLEWVERAIEISTSKRELNHLRQNFRKRLNSLTVREREVYELVIRGNTNKMIAGKLNIKLGTVEFHRSNLMTKMGAKSFSELMENAHEVSFGIQFNPD